MNPQLKITVDAIGNFTEEANCFKGGQCIKEVEALEVLLTDGSSEKKRDHKPEFYAGGAATQVNATNSW